MLEIGDAVEVIYDETKPNKHYQQFMKRYIGRKAIIRGISDKPDSYGYYLVYIKWPDGYVSSLSWREYDFIKLEDKEFKESLKRVKLTDKDFEL